MTEIDPLADREREKYRKMWSIKSYRETSPGLNVAPLALEKLGMRAGDSVLDFGCGEGLAIDWFEERDISAMGVDIVSLRPDIVEGCLWSLPENLTPADFVFCADVLEHIPEEKVDAVLRAIFDHADQGAFMTVATIGCIHGIRHGEVLHLTVKPIEWWADKIQALWPKVEIGRGDKSWRFWIATGKQ